MAGFGSVLRKCPSCGKRFGTGVTGKKLVKEETIERKVREVQGATVGGPFTRANAGGPAQGQSVLTRERSDFVDVKEFEYTYQCKNCGHSWAEVRKEEGKPPKN